MTNHDHRLLPSPLVRRHRLRASLVSIGLALATVPGASHADGASPAAADRVSRADLQALQRVEQLLVDGEAAYHQRRDQEAFATFGQVAALTPDDARAWLRIGNLWQRNGEAWRAIEAYRRAVAGPREEPAGADATAAARIEALLQARSKAAFNLAAIGIEQARAAMQAVDRSRLPADMQPTAEALERRLRAVDPGVQEPIRPALP